MYEATHDLQCLFCPIEFSFAPHKSTSAIATAIRNIIVTGDNNLGMCCRPQQHQILPAVVTITEGKKNLVVFMHNFTLKRRERGRFMVIKNPLWILKDTTLVSKGVALPTFPSLNSTFHFGEVFLSSRLSPCNSLIAQIITTFPVTFIILVPVLFHGILSENSIA